MRCQCLSHNGFLTERGYAELAQRERKRDSLDAMDTRLYLDKVGSVSAMVEGEGQCDRLIDEQYQRFLNGS